MKTSAFCSAHLKRNSLYIIGSIFLRKNAEELYHILWLEYSSRNPFSIRIIERVAIATSVSSFLLTGFRDQTECRVTLNFVQQVKTIAEAQTNRMGKVLDKIADHSDRAVQGMNSNLTQGMDICVRVYSVFAGSGLTTGWSPVQGSLQTV
jgi:predicted DNA-binding ribbon-helix-helix protein